MSSPKCRESVSIVRLDLANASETIHNRGPSFGSRLIVILETGQLHGVGLDVSIFLLDASLIVEKSLPVGFEYFHDRHTKLQVCQVHGLEALLSDLDPETEGGCPAAKTL